MKDIKFAVTCNKNDARRMKAVAAPDGRRLSKRDRDLDLGILRQRMSPEALLGLLAASAGLLDKPEAVSARELASVFSWEKVKKESICLMDTV